MARGEGRHVTKPEAGADAPPPLLRTVARLFDLVGGLKGPGYRLRLWAALALTLVSKVLAVFSPLVLADGINALARGDASGALPTFLGLAGFWAGLRFISAAGPQIRDAIFQPLSEEAQRRAGARVFAHVHSLSVRFHQGKRTGGVYRTIERGVRAIDFLLRFLAFNIAPTVIELLLAAAVLGFKYGWAFSAIAALTVLLYAWMTFGVTEWRLKHRREMNEADTEAAGRAVDSLLNFETVKSFAAEARESERYDRALASYARAAVRAYTSLVVLNVVQSLIMSLGLLAMVVAAGLLVARGPLGPGDITAVILIMTNLYAPLNILGFAYREIKQTSIDMEKMFILLDEAPDVADAPDAAALKPGPGEVAFENISFAHEGRDRGLDGISFIAPAGKTTAIVGPSGAGKSTVLKLIYRFYDPAGGRVLIDGQDLREVTQASLRSALGLVPQDVVLFNDTIRYNIGYGRPEATQGELEEAAARAQLLGFIEKLPQGWDTRVGERGLKLSGGEKQRVGIARVVLKDPRILILDEATSSLDSATEADVQEALEAASRGRTTIVVAHRLSTIANSDQIVVLEEGAIAERGTHASLMARDGLYASLWKRQAEEPAAVAAEQGADQAPWRS
jgi:ATP-binding cassette subfamily B protein